MALDRDQFEAVDAQVNLRFIERKIEGRNLRILQQAWAITTYERAPHEVPVPVGVRTEWRDVPLVTE